MATYDFRASTFFSVEADSMEEAEKLADEWVEENMFVEKGWDVDVQFEEIYEPYG